METDTLQLTRVEASVLEYLGVKAGALQHACVKARALERFGVKACALKRFRVEARALERFGVGACALQRFRVEAGALEHFRVEARALAVHRRKSSELESQVRGVSNGRLLLAELGGLVKVSGGHGGLHLLPEPHQQSTHALQDAQPASRAVQLGRQCLRALDIGHFRGFGNVRRQRLGLGLQRGDLGRELREARLLELVPLRLLARLLPQRHNHFVDITFRCNQRLEDGLLVDVRHCVHHDAHLALHHDVLLGLECHGIVVLVVGNGSLDLRLDLNGPCTPRLQRRAHLVQCGAALVVLAPLGVLDLVLQRRQLRPHGVVHVVGARQLLLLRGCLVGVVHTDLEAARDVVNVGDDRGGVRGVVDVDEVLLEDVLLDLVLLHALDGDEVLSHLERHVLAAVHRDDRHRLGLLVAARLGLAAAPLRVEVRREHKHEDDDAVVHVVLHEPQARRAVLQRNSRVEDRTTYSLRGAWGQARRD